MYGISSDSVETHAAWRAEENLAFPLLSDAQGTCRDAYQVGTFFGLPGRATFVITPDGIVRSVFAGQTDFAGHAEHALQVVRDLVGERTLTEPPHDDG